MRDIVSYRREVVYPWGWVGLSAANRLDSCVIPWAKSLQTSGAGAHLNTSDCSPAVLETCSPPRLHAPRAPVPLVVGPDDTRVFLAHNLAEHPGPNRPPP